MAEYKMGFIGTGNMGSALARAAAKSGERMLLANRTPEKAEALAAVLGAKVGTNLQAAAACEYIFLGVKPQMLRRCWTSCVLRCNQGPTVLSSSRWRPGSRPGRSGRRWALTARSCGSCRTCRSPAARA